MTMMVVVRKYPQEKNIDIFSYRRKESILDALEYVFVLHDLEVLGFAQEHFVRVLAGLKHGRGAGAGVHLRHLLRHLACGCGFFVSYQYGGNGFALFL